MKPSEITARVDARRGYQQTRWGDKHDKQHSTHEWLSMMLKYMGRASEADFAGDSAAMQYALLDVMSLCMAALEAQA